MRTGFFTYPWDLLDEGPEQTIDAMATRLGCNAIALNCNYHHARLLRPRARGPKTLELPGAVAAFEPQRKWYGANGLMPVPDPRLARANVLGRARAACAVRGVDLALWLVGLHNSSLGEQHPELCMHNCFGDVYTYALCPSHAAVQDYMIGITNDVCDQFQPQRLILEAVGYLGMRHGVHHELFMTEWSEALELLLSLCFCPECTRQAERYGVSVAILRERVADVAERLMNEERAAALEGSSSEAASLLMEIPDLARYVQNCARAVTDVVAAAREAARGHRVELEVIPASFHRPVTRAWIEHAPLAALGHVSDGMVILTYFDNAAQVAADLNWAATLAPGVRLVGGLIACAPTITSGSVLTEQAHAVRAAGCSSLYVYNYGMLTPRRLEWVHQAFDAIAA